MVGIFDSGVGGLSVWREIAEQAPHLHTTYVADQAHTPYGGRPTHEVRAASRGIARWLLERGCNVVVVACNTASAVALQTLRDEFPSLRFVGMEPAVKPAAALSRNKVVGVLATPATLDGALFETTIARLDASLTIVRQPCPGLAEAIEADAPVEALVARFLEPSRRAGADTLVLACTHYPLIRDTIQRLAGPAVRIVDPAEAVARQTTRVVESLGAPVERGLEASRNDFSTSGDPERFAQQVQRWLGKRMYVQGLRWRGETLRALASKSGSEREARNARPEPGV